MEQEGFEPSTKGFGFVCLSAFARQMYGEPNIAFVVEDIDEQKKPPTAEQRRIKSLSGKIERYRDLAKQPKGSESTAINTAKCSEINEISRLVEEIGIRFINLLTIFLIGFIKFYLNYGKI